MTLDEAIKHCEEVADGFEETAQEIAMHDENGVYQPRVSWYQDRASSQRQIAEWLRELKALKENDDVKDVFKDCNTCKYLSLDPDDYPCDRCCHRYINQYVYDDKREVNADDYSKHS